MPKKFNITGNCIPDRHYMVDLTSRLVKIKAQVDDGQYLVINRGRQYGKTTTLRALAKFLADEYYVLSLDFQMQMSSQKFESENIFSITLAKIIIRAFRQLGIDRRFEKEINGIGSDIADMKENYGLVDLFISLNDICASSDKPIVLMIDEVDQASNNQVFLDFLAQLRGYYINRDVSPTFRSVILAGVHDIRNLKQKIRPDEAHKHNSPWNIASSFEVDMNFSPADISTMLNEYENDHHTGMDIDRIAQLIYDNTSGYPVLVSTICKHIDDQIHEWNEHGVTEAVKLLINSSSPLFDSLINKLEDNKQLRDMVYDILINGRTFIYGPDSEVTREAEMYGFVTRCDTHVAIANRIFETRLYNWFIYDTVADNDKKDWTADKNQFITNGRLNMKLVLEKFVTHFDELYGDCSEQFLEEDGRRFFLLYLRPIINGTGNYYVEARTRNNRRTDVIVDYKGEQFVIEMKIWRGEEYNARGEKQLTEYLDYYHINTGYLLSFCFNKSKNVGVNELKIGKKTIIEALV